MRRKRKYIFIIVGMALIIVVLLYPANTQPTTPAIELLVRTSDGPGGRARGDIISLKQLPHKGWGRDEGPPHYVIVKVTGEDAKTFAKYHVRHWKVHDFDMSENAPTVRSRYRFDLDSLPAALAGKIETTKQTAFANLVDRRNE